MGLGIRGRCLMNIKKRSSIITIDFKLVSKQIRLLEFTYPTT
jgi:hypothetical protein